jgi:methyl coenzyme M reductase beta subunit
MRKLFLIVSVLSLVVLLPGCAAFKGAFGTSSDSPPDPQLKQTITDTKASIASLKQDAQADLVVAKETGDTDAQKKPERTLKFIGDAEKFTQTAESVVQVDEQGNVNIAATAAGAAPLLPFPFNLIVGVGVPLLVGGVGGVQEMRKRKSDAAARAAIEDAKSIVNHIDTMMTKDDAVKAALKNLNADTKAAAHEQLTPGAKKLIETESVT